MNHKKLLEEMKESIGTRDPVIYFDKLTDLLSSLFQKLEKNEVELKRSKYLLSLAINWDAKIASAYIAYQINELRENKDIYFNEISLFKEAYTKDLVTQNSKDFCDFWQSVLGWHPFLGS
jgi:hypothetical protein